MNEKLKPCPFCGGEAELQYDGRGDREAAGMSFVRCKDCGAIGQKFEVSRRYSSMGGCLLIQSTLWKRKRKIG